MGVIEASDHSRKTGSFLPFFVFLTLAAILVQTWVSIVEDRTLTLASEHQNGLVAVRLLEEHATQTLRDAERSLHPSRSKPGMRR